MTLRKDTDYALQLLVCYAKASREDDRPIFRREVLRETSLTAESQARICRLLRDKGYLEMQQDPYRKEIGYRLIVAPERITLKEVIELTENSTELIATFDKHSQIYDSKIWGTLQNSLDNELENTTIADLLAVGEGNTQ